MADARLLALLASMESTDVALLAAVDAALAMALLPRSA